jgi:hypothetical protein
METRRFEGAAGFHFAGGRGHFMVGGEYMQNDGLMQKVARPNTGRWVTLSNPDGTQTLTPDVGYANAFVGGIITSGVLRNLGFNPDGSLRTLNLGIVNGANMVGGEAPSDDDLSPLITPQKRVAGMARASYEVVEGLKLIGATIPGLATTIVATSRSGATTPSFDRRSGTASPPRARPASQWVATIPTCPTPALISSVRQSKAPSHSRPARRTENGATVPITVTAKRRTTSTRPAFA